jgi:hypothetical protein
MEYAVYLNRIAQAYETFLEQNATWMKRQELWRVEDLARRDQWELEERNRWKLFENVYREEVRRNLQLKDMDELLKRHDQRKDHE